MLAHGERGLLPGLLTKMDATKDFMRVWLQTDKARASAVAD